MARKKQLSKEKRVAIITLRNDGQLVRKIVKTLKVSPSAVAKTTKRYKETGSHEDRPRKGRPSITSASEDKYIRVTSLRNCRLTAAQIRDQDNDPKHTSRLCKGYLTKKESDGVLRQMTWPPQSPNLNPIEMVWGELDHRVKAKGPTSAKHLRELLQGCWKTISGDYLLKLIKRMPRVCKAVIKELKHGMDSVTPQGPGCHSDIAILTGRVMLLLEAMKEIFYQSVISPWISLLKSSSTLLGLHPWHLAPSVTSMLESSCKVVKEGLLEKRSDGLLQLWKKKRCLLTEEGLLLIPPKQLDHHQQQPPPPSSPTEPARIKELHFSNMKTVDCVERKGKYVYFTVVMAEGREIDFRCPQDEGWNAEITLQMVQYKNRQAILAVKSTRQKQQHLVQQHLVQQHLVQQHGHRIRSASNSA
ncbi:unnamed protein product [Ranitomeya imitator]|uniref:PH domain-containing protein n=2 Tax=Ranitomeya imitator TaxID=111125 RepID=A0ABN9MLQ1_9NEOB|nr:unnamed protein product [Ranitomeya imitator]